MISRATHDFTISTSVPIKCCEICYTVNVRIQCPSDMVTLLPYPLAVNIMSSVLYYSCGFLLHFLTASLPYHVILKQPYHSIYTGVYDVVVSLFYT